MQMAGDCSVGSCFESAHVEADFDARASIPFEDVSWDTDTCSYVS
jgi:hypothetical protein